MPFCPGNASKQHLIRWHKINLFYKMLRLKNQVTWSILNLGEFFFVGLSYDSAMAFLVDRSYEFDEVRDGFKTTWFCWHPNFAPYFFVNWFQSYSTNIQIGWFGSWFNHRSVDLSIRISDVWIQAVQFCICSFIRDVEGFLEFCDISIWCVCRKHGSGITPGNRGIRSLGVALKEFCSVSVFISRWRSKLINVHKALTSQV